MLCMHFNKFGLNETDEHVQRAYFALTVTFICARAFVFTKMENKHNIQRWHFQHSKD